MNFYLPQRWLYIIRYCQCSWVSFRYWCQRRRRYLRYSAISRTIERKTEKRNPTSKMNQRYLLREMQMNCLSWLACGNRTRERTLSARQTWRCWGILRNNRRRWNCALHECAYMCFISPHCSVLSGCSETERESRGVAFLYSKICILTKKITWLSLFKKNYLNKFCTRIK